MKLSLGGWGLMTAGVWATASSTAQACLICSTLLVQGGPCFLSCLVLTPSPVRGPVLTVAPMVVLQM